jgi:Arc/MetJ family transcription regulator
VEGSAVPFLNVEIRRLRVLSFSGQLHAHKGNNVIIVEDTPMTVTVTSIRLDTHLADEAVRVLGVTSRTEAIHVALSEIVALERLKNLMKKRAGKLSFDGYDD